MLSPYHKELVFQPKYGRETLNGFEQCCEIIWFISYRMIVATTVGQM